MTTSKTPHPFPQGTDSPPRLLITAGPTHEPIDAVRYIGNRSSGRLGIELAEHAIDLHWPVRLLLGPTSLTPRSSQLDTRGFQSTADLAECLNIALPECDILVMAAAVADYTPASPSPTTKLRRSENAPLSIELRPTPDLLADCAKQARSDQLLIGFALEPEAELHASARAKLTRKGIDLILANPLDTMESPAVRASLLASQALRRFETEFPPLPKAEFAHRLLPILRSAWLAKRAAHPASTHA